MTSAIIIVHRCNCIYTFQDFFTIHIIIPNACTRTCTNIYTRIRACAQPKREICIHMDVAKRSKGANLKLDRLFLKEGK